MEKIITFIFVDLQGHIFAILAGLVWFMVKSDKRFATHSEVCGGKFNVIGTEITGIKKGVDENKKEIKGLKTEQEKIKLSIAEKFGHKKETMQKTMQSFSDDRNQ